MESSHLVLGLCGRARCVLPDLAGIDVFEFAQTVLSFVDERVAAAKSSGEANRANGDSHPPSRPVSWCINFLRGSRLFHSLLLTR